MALAAVAAVCASAQAQTGQDLPTPQPVATPEAAPRPMPFTPGSESSGSAAPIEFRSSDRMSQQDRDLAAGAEPAIGERAGSAGLEFDQAFEKGKWDEQQIVCPALPNHLFLQFTRNNGPGDVSVFTASIPRGGNGRVRIIPILRRGYTSFSGAPASALTISVFNHIRGEEHAAKGPGWLATSLCYAALAGVHAEVGPMAVTDAQQLQAAAPPPVLMIPVQGGAVISFTDMSAAPRPMEWTMTFDGQGKLAEVTQSPAPRLSAKVVVLTPAEVKGVTIPVSPADAKARQAITPQSPGKVIRQAPVELQGKPVPQRPVDLTGKPVPQ